MTNNINEIYRSKFHKNQMSHDVIIIEDSSNIGAGKLKMTYECYNGNEKFTGERFVNGEWVFNFSMLDLGFEVYTKSYVSSDEFRLERANTLIASGLKYFNMLNN
jgi:hypothetical protein